MTDSWWTFEDALSPEHDLCRKEIKRLTGSVTQPQQQRVEKSKQLNDA